jgi:hypothetical protein
MTEPVSSYPLQWPAGWRRIESCNRRPAMFRTSDRSLTVNHGVDRVLRELELLGIPHEDVTISTDLRTRRGDGFPRSDQGEPRDPGAAAYWTRSNWKRPKCLAIDRYTRVADNLGAIAATLFAMRAIERHGGAEILERAFDKFVALAAPEQPWQVLELPTSRPTRREIDAAFARLASRHHPDHGGDLSAMKRINLARDELYPEAPP